MALGVNSSGKLVACGDSIINGAACCSKEDESTYILPCCPSVSVACASSSLTATLLGFSEFGDASTPPKKYLNASQSGSIVKTCYNGFEERTADVSAHGSYTYVPGGTDVNTLRFDSEQSGGEFSPGNPIPTVSDSCDNLYCGLLQIFWVSCKYPYIDCDGSDSFTPTSIVDTALTRTVSYSRTDECGGVSGAYVATLDEGSEDTEAAAIARETPVGGTSCSSVFETRSTGFSLQKRTSSYTLNMSNLIAGVQYRVKPYIRRRTAVIGSYGSWEDVATSWATFTASGTTHSIGPTALTHTQGYEYAITGAFIEKT